MINDNTNTKSESVQTTSVEGLDGAACSVSSSVVDSETCDGVAENYGPEVAEALCAGKLRIIETHETKVSDSLHIGMELLINTIFGPGKFRVTEMDRDAGFARAMSGRMFAILKRREDGWYDQHVHGNADGVIRVNFV